MAWCLRQIKAGVISLYIFIYNSCKNGLEVERNGEDTAKIEETDEWWKPMMITNCLLLLLLLTNQTEGLRTVSLLPNFEVTMVQDEWFLMTIVYITWLLLLG